jgi:mannose-6-phosphate isomerase-like protein (cupin superfamily)
MAAPESPTGPAASGIVVLQSCDLLMTPKSRTVKFEGRRYDAEISFFLVDMDPGAGPEPHLHPYAEVFVPLDGRVLIRSDDDEREVGPGRIVVVGPNVQHGFTNVATGRLRMACLHASGHMVTDWLDGQGWT